MLNFFRSQLFKTKNALRWDVDNASEASVGPTWSPLIWPLETKLILTLYDPVTFRSRITIKINSAPSFVARLM